LPRRASESGWFIGIREVRKDLEEKKNAFVFFDMALRRGASHIQIVFMLRWRARS